MQKTNLSKITVLCGLILGSVFSMTQIKNFSATLAESNTEPTEIIETETNKDNLHEIQLYPKTENFTETKRIKENKNIVIGGEITAGSKKHKLNISYEQTATKKWKIKKIELEENLELEVDLQNRLKKTPRVNLKELVQTVESHQRNKEICEVTKNSIQNIQIIDCLSDIITLQTSGVNISFNLIDLTVVSIETNQQEINQKLEKFHDTTLNENAFVPYVLNTIETAFETTPQEEPIAQEINPSDEVKSKFQEILGVNISTISQRDNNFLIEFTLKELNMTANYKKDQNQIQGLFLKDIIINGNPLLIRTFTLTLQQESQETQDFIEDPLSFIEKFYPNIKELYTKNN